MFLYEMLSGEKKNPTTSKNQTKTIPALKSREMFGELEIVSTKQLIVQD